MNQPDHNLPPTDFGILFKQALDDRSPDTQAQLLKQNVLAAYRHSRASAKPPFPRDEDIYGKTAGPFNKLFLRPMLPIILAIALIFAGTGTAIAADHAKPGDALYPVDRALERVAYNFTTSDTAKADLLVKFADEREQEQATLAKTNRTQDTEQATQDTEQALQNATEVIDRVQSKQEEKGNTHAAESLNKVEIKLNDLRNRFTERQREEVKNKVKNALGEVEIEATIKNGQATVDLKYSGQETKYTLDATDINAIIASVQQRTTLSTDDIKVLLKIEQDNEPSDTNSNANVNSARENENELRQNANLNSQKNENKNLDSDIIKNVNTNSDQPDLNENSSDQGRVEGQGQSNGRDN